MSTSFICHDFKSPRNDNSRRLPGSMRVIPVLFFGVSLFSLFSIFTDVRSMRESDEKKVLCEAQRDEAVAAKARLETELTALTKEQALADQVAKWVEGTRIVQPITVAVSRAVGMETFISDMTLERIPDVPSQLNLSLKLSNAGQPETEKINAALSRLRYKPHSPSVGRAGDETEYRTLLVWQEN
jgi:hypothetical protein